MTTPGPAAQTPQISRCDARPARANHSTRDARNHQTLLRLPSVTGCYRRVVDRPRPAGLAELGPPPIAYRAFRGRPASTSAHDLRRSACASLTPRAFSLVMLTHPNRAAYGAGMIPGCLTSLSKSRSVHLQPTGKPLSRLNAANIFLPTEKTRSAPHLMSSVAPGSARQNSWSVAALLDFFFAMQPCRDGRT